MPAPILPVFVSLVPATPKVAVAVDFIAPDFGEFFAKSVAVLPTGGGEQPPKKGKLEGDHPPPPEVGEVDAETDGQPPNSVIQSLFQPETAKMSSVVVTDVPAAKAKPPVSVEPVERMFAKPETGVITNPEVSAPMDEFDPPVVDQVTLRIPRPPSDPGEPSPETAPSGRSLPQPAAPVFTGPTAPQPPSQSPEPTPQVSAGTTPKVRPVPFPPAPETPRPGPGPEAIAVHETLPQPDKVVAVVTGPKPEGPDVRFLPEAPDHVPSDPSEAPPSDPKGADELAPKDVAPSPSEQLPPKSLTIPPASQSPAPATAQVTDPSPTIDQSSVVAPETSPVDGQPTPAAPAEPTSEAPRENAEVRPLTPEQEVQSQPADRQMVTDQPDKTEFSARTLDTPAPQAPASPRANVPPAPLPPQTIQQITTHATDHSGTTHLTLTPEDLGSVEIQVSSSDRGVTVTVLAERGDTADLLRRNHAELERALRGAGFDNVSFGFDHQQGKGQNPANHAPQRDFDPRHLAGDSPAPTPYTKPVRRDGLDIRI